jgi:hypothetical protein
MSQTLSRMERLARAEEERKRFRQAAASHESSAPTQLTVPVPKSAPLHNDQATTELAPPLNQIKESVSDSPFSLPQTYPEITVAQDAPVASYATTAPNAAVAHDATVAPNTTVDYDATVAPEPSPLYPDAAVAPNTTVAHETTVARSAPVEIRGYGPFTWDLLDGIMPRLDPYEQVVLLRLCRLAWGHKKDTCRVGYERLQQACNLKKRKLQEVISKLEFLGYIQRLALEQGGSDRSLRGTEYQILLTPPPGVLRTTVASGATVAPVTTVAPDATNKKNALKENYKEGLPSRAKECPDCSGTSWFYPKGIEGGVKRCTHPKVPRVGT